ncbi:hypothetical protein LXL04_034554 [Taraxacum kok-saghyz]
MEISDEQAIDLNSELACIHDSARPLVNCSDVQKHSKNRLWVQGQFWVFTKTVKILSRFGVLIRFKGMLFDFQGLYWSNKHDWSTRAISESCLCLFLGSGPANFAVIAILSTPDMLSSFAFGVGVRCQNETERRLLFWTKNAKQETWLCKKRHKNSLEQPSTRESLESSRAATRAANNTKESLESSRTNRGKIVRKQHQRTAPRKHGSEQNSRQQSIEKQLGQPRNQPDQQGQKRPKKHSSRKWHQTKQQTEVGCWFYAYQYRLHWKLDVDLLLFATVPILDLKFVRDLFCKSFLWTFCKYGPKQCFFQNLGNFFEPSFHRMHNGIKGSLSVLNLGLYGFGFIVWDHFCKIICLFSNKFSCKFGPKYVEFGFVHWEILEGIDRLNCKKELTVIQAVQSCVPRVCGFMFFSKKKSRMELTDLCAVRDRLLIVSGFMLFTEKSKPDLTDATISIMIFFPWQGIWSGVVSRLTVQRNHYPKICGQCNIIRIPKQINKMTRLTVLSKKKLLVARFPETKPFVEQNCRRRIARVPHYNIRVCSGPDFLPVNPITFKTVSHAFSLGFQLSKNVPNLSKPGQLARLSRFGQFRVQISQNLKDTKDRPHDTLATSYGNSCNSKTETLNDKPSDVLEPPHIELRFVKL